MKVHWTARSIKDYLFRIATDFIAQLENKMDSLPISQDELAKRLGVTKGRVSQLINHPGNISLGIMIEYAKALGMKLSVVAYEDDDLENKKGPIDSEIFKICWEKCGKPRDFWDMQSVVYTDVASATTYAANVPIKHYDAELLYGWDIFSESIVPCTGYFSVEHSAGSQIILKRGEFSLPS